MILDYKDDIRGPYKDIRWFCPDSTVIPPKEKCEDEGGIQHARYKDDVTQLAEKNHVYFGQILAGSCNEDFWDAKHNNLRIKQYQLEKYLRDIDDGWIMQKGQFYRGALQVQDEEEWGINFLTELLGNYVVLEKQYYLTRQAVRDIPHKSDVFLRDKIWALSKEIADDNSSFIEIRTKIHSQPDAQDLVKVIAYKKENAAKLSEESTTKINDLIQCLEQVYAAPKVSTILPYVNKIDKKLEIRKLLDTYVDEQMSSPPSISKIITTAELIYAIRQEIGKINKSASRLALMDISILLEDMFFHEIYVWKPQDLDDLLEKICFSGMALTGTGFIENWEWEILENNFTTIDLNQPNRKFPDGYYTLRDLISFQESTRKLVSWGSSMPRAVYQDVVELFGAFEPLSYGYFDEQIHNSILLSLGQSLQVLDDIIAREADFSNNVMGIANQNNIRALNSGYAKGKLIVVEDGQTLEEISSDNIYIFNKPPRDLQPVAGIATVQEGNRVSHIQLLARNLGIPNASLTSKNLQDLKSKSGQEVFYAVSEKGKVIMKPSKKMTKREKKLFNTKKRKEKKVTVPTNKLDLTVNEIINMREISASNSGVICGPKAANLGELKQMYPDKVVEGLVIPFGVFRHHLNQKMPDQEISYWHYLTGIFDSAIKLEEEGHSEEDIEIFILDKLSIFRKAFEKIKFTNPFIADLKAQFKEAFGKELGKVPVFIRSDTNMEDLSEFTGAGLNKSVFNVVSFKSILKGIRQVWASPYTERSYRWRQHYLTNPENVFPSILIIPSVDVEYSGVLVTKGITTGDKNDLTIAFSRGAGGAVDGQAAEMWLLDESQYNILLSPAREAKYRRLPISGGTSSNYATYDEPILNAKNVYDLRVLASDVQDRFPTFTKDNSGGPYDVELGFKDDKIWLFQIRPFVENKNAQSSDYLESISPKIKFKKKVSNTTKISGNLLTLR